VERNPFMAQAQTPSKGARSFLAWVWAGVLIVAGLAFLASNFRLYTPGNALILVVAGGTAALSVPFLARWLVKRQDWWALITAWVFFAIAVLLGVIFLNPRAGQVAGIVALLELGAPFAVTYFVNRKHWWALIPAYAMLILGSLLALTTMDVPLELLGSVALLAIALPFWVIYIADRQQWWALIPAGGIGAIGTVLLVYFSLAQSVGGVFFIVLNTALAAAFLALWLAFRRFDWALWIAVGFAGAAVLSIWYPSAVNWAVLALMLGIYIAYRQIRPAQRAPVAVAQASTQPTPVPPPPPPVPPAPPSPAAPVGAQADKEAPPPGVIPGESKPLIEFRPLDPLKGRETDEGE
jgi:hypothetical protein